MTTSDEYKVLADDEGGIYAAAVLDAAASIAKLTAGNALLESLLATARERNETLFNRYYNVKCALVEVRNTRDQLQAKLDEVGGERNRLGELFGKAEAVIAQVRALHDGAVTGDLIDFLRDLGSLIDAYDVEAHQES